MTTKSQIEKAKECFLAKYNPSRSTDVALGLAISVSLQRNPTYSQKHDPLVREAFRAEWRNMLRTVSLNASLFHEMSQACDLILWFRDEMRHKLADGCLDASLSDTAFRVSHAQKSIAVYLKHLWCIGLVRTPVLCPVDRRIMTVSNAPYPLRSWTLVDEIDLHKDQVRHLLNCARRSGFSLAEWELLKFQAM